MSTRIEGEGDRGEDESRYGFSAMSMLESQQKILDAVLRVIVRDGVPGASMRAFAREADVSLGLVTYHFPDKSSLITEAFERASARVLEASLEAVDGLVDADERLRQFIRVGFDEEFLDGNHLAWRISLWALSLTDADVAAVYDAFSLRYMGHLIDFISAARPGLGPEEIVARAEDVVTFGNGLWLSWARVRDRGQLERGIRRCETIALDPA